MMDDEQPVSEFKSKSGVKRIFAAFFYSIDGLKAAWKNEHAFRQEVVLAVPAVIVALLLPVSALEKLMLISVVVMVLIVELVNSAIEAIVDKASPEFHELAGRAKDMGSAAVLLLMCNVMLCWGLILWPRFG